MSVAPFSWLTERYGDDLAVLFRPDDYHLSSQPLLDWLKASRCSRLAIHFDVDAVDSNEIIFGLGAEPDGLTSTQARRLVVDVSAVADVVGLTIAELIPPQVIRLQQVLRDLPLIPARKQGPFGN